MRADLTPGMVAAQVAHAAGESSPGRGTLVVHDLPPYGEATFAVVLGVPDEAALGRLAVRLLRAGLPFRAIYEPDPPFHGALMALGLAPGRKSEIYRHLSDVSLYRCSSPSPAGVVQRGHVQSAFRGSSRIDEGSTPSPGITSASEAQEDEHRA